MSDFLLSCSVRRCKQRNSDGSSDENTFIDVQNMSVGELNRMLNSLSDKYDYCLGGQELNDTDSGEESSHEGLVLSVPTWNDNSYKI